MFVIHIVNQYGERTLTWSNYNTNAKGEWVANPFGVSFGDPYRDTRFFQFWDFDMIVHNVFQFSSKFRNYYPYE